MAGRLGGGVFFTIFCSLVACLTPLQTSNHDKPSDTLQLMGGKVDDLGNRILGIDDGVSQIYELI